MTEFEKEYIKDYILRSAGKGILLQNKDGSMPSGKNGPWNDEVTPVRNTAHWAILFLNASSFSYDNDYQKAALKCYNYLFLKKSCPFNASYYFRNERNIKENTNNSFQPTTMSGNGLIGQAWVLESLLTGYDKLKRDDLINAAKRLYVIHKFDFKKGLYHQLGVDGTIKKIQSSFNQQLWFAAMGAKLKKITDENMDEINIFLKKLWSNVVLNKKSIVGQKTKKKIFATIYHQYINRSYFDRSIGYLSFILHGFAILKMYTKNNSFWDDDRWKQFLTETNTFINSQKYFEICKKNRFAFKYNLTGIEISFFKKIFGLKDDYKLLDYNFKNHWDENEQLLSKNTSDPETLSARLYEAAYLL